MGRCYLLDDIRDLLGTKENSSGINIKKIIDVQFCGTKIREILSIS